MPAKHPRLTITIDPTVHAQLRRLSELTGNSQSALIAELLTGTQPVFTRLITVLEAANDARSQLKGQLAKELHLAQDRLERGLGMESPMNVARLAGAAAHLEQAQIMEERSRPLPGFEVQHRGRRKAPQAVGAMPPAQGSTPMSNRGVRSTTKTGQSPNEKRGVKRGSI